jgi:hypothetical protein
VATGGIALTAAGTMTAPRIRFRYLKTPHTFRNLGFRLRAQYET